MGSPTTGRLPRTWALLHVGVLLIASIVVGVDGASGASDSPTLTARTGDVPTSIVLQWSAPGAEPAEWHVYRTTVEGGNETATVFGGAVLTWTDVGRIPGVRYVYRVAAWDSSGEGPRSAPAAARAALWPAGADADEDRVPDAVEVACTSAVVKRIMADLSGFAGGCSPPGPGEFGYVPPTETAPVLREALADPDGDGIPDDDPHTNVVPEPLADDLVPEAFQNDDMLPDPDEAVLCYVENQNFPEDGTCVGADWGWPP